LLPVEQSINALMLDNNIQLLDKAFLCTQLPAEIAADLENENHNQGTQYLHGSFQKID
jgi:hypothetical protein